MAAEFTAEVASPRLKLMLRPKAESIVRGGHPWVYSDSIRSRNREGLPGELAVIYDRKDKFLAMGFYDPESPIRVRILHLGKPVKLTVDWWRNRLGESLARREGIAGAETNGLRLVNGESDGWPGFVMDRYGETLVAKVYAAAWLLLLDTLLPVFMETIAPERIVLRMSRNLLLWAAEHGSPGDGAVLYGSVPEGMVEFLENGVRFEADVCKGQKTGFFLDQRENRKRVGELSKGAEVLNAFSFSGGFSLFAAKGGARSVTDLDISDHALEASARNFERNRTDPGVAACEHRRVRGDAFEWIEAGEDASFDLVIVDPPSLAKREAERIRAIQAYGKLNANAIRLLRPGGILVAASCSAHVTESEFYESVRAAARRSGRGFVEMETRGHAPDHVATFPEAQYLKCLYLRFE